jgi:hypothetical protein
MRLSLGQAEPYRTPGPIEASRSLAPTQQGHRPSGSIRVTVRVVATRRVHVLGVTAHPVGGGWRSRPATFSCKSARTLPGSGSWSAIGMPSSPSRSTRSSPRRGSSCCARRSGAAGERLRGAVGGHRAAGGAGSDAHLEASAAGVGAGRVRRPLQPAPSAPFLGTGAATRAWRSSCRRVGWEGRTAGSTRWAGSRVCAGRMKVIEISGTHTALYGSPT